MTRWTGRGDATRWTDAANWTNGVPTAGVPTIFSGGVKAVRLVSDTPLTAGALIVQGGSLTLQRGRLNLMPAPADNGNTFDLNLRHKAQLTIAADAKLIGTHVAQIGDGSSHTELTVYGTIAEDYGIVAGGKLDVSGTHAHWLSGDSGLFFNSGTLVVEGGGRVDAGTMLKQYPAAALDLEGDSTGLVTGSGSEVRLANTFVSENFGTSSLVVANGAHVFSGGGAIGGNGDGSLTVTGAASVFSASRGIVVGGQVPVNSALTVTDHGSVKLGEYGLTLSGTLALDGTATFRSPFILSDGGVIDALDGAVTITSALKLDANPTDPFTSKTTYLVAAAGATLTLAGVIASAVPNDSSVVLDAASGHIVLSHPNGGFAGTTELYGAVLEIAANKAAGTGHLHFAGGSEHPATILIDAGVTFGNPISGFGTGDKIDLAGFAFSHDVVAFTASPDGGTLTVSNDHGQVESLHFADQDLSLSSFSVMSDGHHGTCLFM